jgi:hypothetical protein
MSVCAIRVRGGADEGVRPHVFVAGVRVIALRAEEGVPPELLWLLNFSSRLKSWGGLLRREAEESLSVGDPRDECLCHPGKGRGERGRPPPRVCGALRADEGVRPHAICF